MYIFASNHICLRIPCQAILLIITNQLPVSPPDCPKSPRETEILRTPNKARSGFSILTEEYLTFQTVSPINHPYRDATHISIVASPLALFCRIVLPALHFFEQPACRTFGNTADYQQFTQIYESQVTYFFMQPVFGISCQHVMYQCLRRYS